MSLSIQVPEAEQKSTILEGAERDLVKEVLEVSPQTKRKHPECRTPSKVDAYAAGIG